MMQKAAKQLEKVLAFLLFVFMTLMVIDVSWQVAARFLSEQPSSVTEELARYLLLWIGLLGSAYAFRKRAHLGVDIFVTCLSPVNKKLAYILVQCICILFAVLVMVWGGAQLVFMQFELGQTSAALMLKVGYVYAAIPAAGVCICIFAVSNIFYIEALDHAEEEPS